MSGHTDLRYDAGRVLDHWTLPHHGAIWPGTAVSITGSSLGIMAVNEQVAITPRQPASRWSGDTRCRKGRRANRRGNQICLTGYITDPVNDTDCVTLFPDTLPSTGGEPVSQSQNWGWVAAAGILIAGLGGYAIRRRTA